MTKANSNVGSIVRSSAETIQSALDSAESKVITACRAMHDAGAPLPSIEKGGEYLQELTDGVLIGWQGAEFFAAYMDAKGKGGVKLSGKVINNKTSRTVTVEFTRREWQQKLSSKVAKVRARYAEFLQETADADADAKGGKAKGGKAGKAGSNILGMVDKTCAAWIARLDKIKGGSASPPI
ncbi:MAG TPA: hypothetical protein VIG24_06575 [Acidimicrobiia bacterium]